MQKQTVRSSAAIRASLDADVLSAYRRERSRDALARALTTAREALRAARFEVKPSAFDWREGRGERLYSFEYTRAGFLFVAEVIRDESSAPDAAAYGEFSERKPMSYFGYGEAENFIGERRNWRDYLPANRARRRDVSAMYDVPADRPTPDSFPTFYRDFHSGGREAVWYTPDVSEKEQRESYAGCGKALAAELAHLTVRGDRSGLKTLRDIYESRIEYVGVRVRCFAGVTELGESSVWGVDFDGSDFSYINECVENEESGARAAAVKMLPKIIDRLGEELAELRELRAAVEADAARDVPILADAPRVTVEVKKGRAA
jgi:hypothetical protein